MSETTRGLSARRDAIAKALEESVALPDDDEAGARVAGDEAIAGAGGGRASQVKSPLQIVVLGMHRSGTSALTGALSRMGIVVGDDDELTAKNWENPDGFFERRDMRAVCDALLQGSQAEWWKVSAFDPDNIDYATAHSQRSLLGGIVGKLNQSGRAWAVKEPRLCVLLPIVRSALVHPFVVMMVRHPLEVAHSLRRRNGFPLQAGLALWEAYTLAAARYAQAIDHVVIGYDDMVNDPAGMLGALAKEFAKRGVDQLDVAAAAAGINPQLHREAFTLAEAEQRLSESQIALWRRLEASDRLKGEFGGLPAASLQILREFEVDYAGKLKLESEIKARRSENEKLKEAIDDLKAKLKASEAKRAEPDQQRVADRERLDKSLAELARNEMIIEGLREKLSDQKSLADEFRGELQIKRTENETIRENLEMANSKLANLETEAADRRQQLELLSNQAALFLAESDALKSELKGAREAAALKSADLERLSQTHAELKEELSRVRIRVRAQEKAARQADEEADALKRRYSEALEGAKARIAQLEAEIASVHSRVSDQKNELDAACERAKVLAGRLSDRETGLANLRSELSKVRFNLRSAETLLAEERAAGRRLKRQNSLDSEARTREIESLRKHAADIHASLEAARCETEQLRKDRQNLSDQALRGKSRRIEELTSPPTGPLSLRRQFKMQARALALSGRMRKVQASGLFDPVWYRSNNPDIVRSYTDPLLHYLSAGSAEGRSPHPLFDPRYYLEQRPEAARTGQTLLEHYLSEGVRLGINPHPMFHTSWYLEINRDVADAGMNPLVHFLASGAKEERDPCPEFSVRDYMERHPELEGSPINPLIHHCLTNDPRFALMDRVEEHTGRSPEPVDQADHNGSRTAESQGQGAANNAAEDTPSSIGGKENELPDIDMAGLPDYLKETIFGRKLSEILAYDAPDGFLEAFERSEAKLGPVKRWVAGQATLPLVSIIMPTHNRAHIIADAIQSVREQVYSNWELFVCDDGSTDNTQSIVRAFADPRIRYLKLEKAGAAAARNAGLAHAQGEFIAYLDSDNYWHPAFLARMSKALIDQPGRSCAYGNYIDFEVNSQTTMHIRSFERPAFSQERLLAKNYIDLNSFVHRRELYDCFGGFNADLTRRQDYDLIIKYTWLRDPVRVVELIALYQRNEALKQITRTMADDNSCIEIINRSVARYLVEGLPLAGAVPVKSVTVLSWDLCRNHFSKPYAVAEALSNRYDVQLISFRFFEEDIFPPLKHATPNFETVYLQGSEFPDFFAAMQKAAAAVRGDVIYVVKPRLPSLGVGLLASHRSGAPVILEINDLETVVTSPTEKDRHGEVSFQDVDLSNPELINPYSNLWSQIMDPIAKSLPVLMTHNRSIDEHFGFRCLYMRNLKDEAVYDPDLYDRDLIRAELGYTPEDRVLLFGGMIRKHKGVYELIELIERLDDPRYKLLFAGSRITPDQTKLVKQFGDTIRVLPPQDRDSMAQINFAADLVVLWLDPDVPASHYQMPYKATDAFAMGPTVIGNSISDLDLLGRQGYLHNVPFGDWGRMTEQIKAIFEDQDGRSRMRDASRRLYLRQFSYAAARGNFELAVRRAMANADAIAPVADRFAKRFADFHQDLTGKPLALPEPARQRPLLSRGPASPNEQPGGIEVEGQAALGAEAEDDSITIVDVRDVGNLAYSDDVGVAIIMPSIDTSKALATARLLVKRAGMPARLFVVEDTLRQGFIKTLNDAAERLNTRYIVYLAEDAFPGVDWLRIAYEQLETTGKGLLAFNCGKWRGRIAAFGMVRTSWVKELYGGPILYPGYMAHKADNELTVIARVTDHCIYEPNSVLVEVDAKKIFRENVPEDKELFRARFRTGFEARVPVERLKPLAKEYFVPWDIDPKVQGRRATARRMESDERSSGFFRQPLSPSEVEALKRDYIKSDLAKEADTFVLYRIIGNDLFPRHEKGQSRKNLEFILDHEPILNGCDKRFILNRIIDKHEEESIMSILQNAGMKYVRIPFNYDEYSDIGFDHTCFEEPGFLAKTIIDQFDHVKQQRIQLALYRLKNNYVMNNNGARNVALQDGKLRAKWVLPFDGNCFFTEKGWEQLAGAVSANPFFRFFVVPMTRVQNNLDLLKPDFFPEAVEEPQLVFRKDAMAEFNPEFCYGRRPKVELLWRLGVAGKWDAYKDDPWDLPRGSMADEARQFSAAGWVARLFSGQAHLESQDAAGADGRYLARAEAILGTLRHLDVSLSRAGPGVYTSLRTEEIERELSMPDQGGLKEVLEKLHLAAEEALTRGPYSVCDKTTLPPSGDAHDYWHPAPYWWPDPQKADGLPFVRRDGERVPGTRMYEPQSDSFDRTRLQRVFDDTFQLALAAHYFVQPHYAEHAVRIVERFFVDPETRMNPHLEYGQVRMGHNGNRGAATGVIETKDFYFFLDGVRMLENSGAISGPLGQELRAWLESFLDWVLNSKQGKAERTASNNHGTCFDLQVSAIASFLGRTEVLYETLARAQSRIAEQFAPDGSQPHELGRRTTAHYCCFNLQSWINLAELADRWGVNLWDYETADGAGIKQGIRWLISHMGKPWPYEQIDEFDSDRFLPIWFASRMRGESSEDGRAFVPVSHYTIKPVFFPHDGIRPFWNLGSLTVRP